MSDPRTIELGNDGTFEIENVEPGTHSLYYMGETNPESLTKEEIKEQAKTTTLFKTSIAKELDKLKLENRAKALKFEISENKAISLYDMMKKNVKNDNIDFNVQSSVSGTNGIYKTVSTDNGVPVYYYRGQVDNNIIFGGFCWKIVRTTETKGVKLIYNGVASNGECNNTGENTIIGGSTYNETNNDNAFVGYMYGSLKNQEYHDTKSVDLEMKSRGTYGSSYTYNSNNGMYYLSGDIKSSVYYDSSYIVTNRYTCGSTSTSCSKLYYLKGYYANSSFCKYSANIYSTSSQSSSYSGAHSNYNNSTIKTLVDNWYKNNLLTYASYIEDTVYCSDRNISGGGSTYNNTWRDTGSINAFSENESHYASISRSSYYTINLMPSLVCKNTQGSVPENNDAFTVSSSIGNGKLTYPIGLITADETIYAGFNSYGSNSSSYTDNNYLYSNIAFWTMTPVFYYTNVNKATVGVIYKNQLSANATNQQDRFVRPVISLKQGTKATGTGTTSDPYVVE